MTTLAKQTDKRIKEILQKIKELQWDYEGLTDQARYAAGQVRYWRTNEWSNTWQAVVESTNRRVHEALEERSKVAAQHDQLMNELVPLQRIWDKHNWSRFYLVAGNNGHIHKSMNCHSCYDDTKYIWLVELSGDSEEEAVAAEGEILCTFCFTSAPVAWTEGVGRRTKEMKDAAAALKAERLAEKVAKSLTLDGSVFRIRAEKSRDIIFGIKDFKTLKAAELWLVPALAYKEVKGRFPEAYIGGAPDAYSPENVDIVLQMIAQKKGITPTEVLAATATRVANKVEDLVLWVTQ
jgi:hypothetical protein